MQKIEINKKISIFKIQDRDLFTTLEVTEQPVLCFPLTLPSPFLSWREMEEVEKDRLPSCRFIIGKDVRFYINSFCHK